LQMTAGSLFRPPPAAPQASQRRLGSRPVISRPPNT
jgi:hypothetical protein